MSVRRRWAALLLVAFAASVATDEAAGQEVGAWERARAAYDPGADDPAALARLAASASRQGALPRFRALLDSVVAADPNAANSRQYWGALVLGSGGEVDRVSRVYLDYVEGNPGDGAAIAAFARVLAGHGALAAAVEVIDLAQEAGASRAAIGVPLGEVREARGEPEEALEAYLWALPSEEASARIAELVDELADEPGASVRVRERLERAREGAPTASAAPLAPLLVRASLATEAWEAALEAAADSALGPGERAGALRSVARAARRRDPGVATRALERLVAIGPPHAGPPDRLLLAELARERGDPAAAGSARRAPGAGFRGTDALVAVETARATGHPDTLRAAVDRALREGIPPELLAVPRGDLWLRRGRADSAAAAYAAAGPSPTTRPIPLSALGRIRLATALVRAGAAGETVAEIGEALIAAPADPSASDRLEAAVEELDGGEEASVARALLRGLAGEWRGRGGDPAGASASLEAAAREAPAGEAAALLLAAGRWAEAAERGDRARGLWRRVALEHPGTPYALEARRLLADGGER